MEHQGPVSNEAEFEYWLASAFENERMRLRDRAVTQDPQPKPVGDLTVADPKKEEA